MNPAPPLKDEFTEADVIDERGLFTSLEYFSYRVISKTPFKDYLQGQEDLFAGTFDLALANFKRSATALNPYGLYTMYKVYATNNPFGVANNKEKAWYYLVCAAVLFHASLIKEKAAIEMLKKYFEKLDNETFDNTMNLISTGIDDDLTIFKENKELIRLLFNYVTKNEGEQQAEALKTYFREHEDFEKDFVPLYLRLNYNRDYEGMQEFMKGNNIKAFINDNVKDYIFLFTQTGVFPTPDFSTAQVHSIFAAILFFIFHGKNADDDYENLVLEVYKYCQLVLNQKEIKLSPLEDPSVAIFREYLDNFARLLIAYLYTSGYYLAKNLDKAADVLSNVKEEEPVPKGLESLRDYLYINSKYKIHTAKEEKEKLAELFENFHKKYNKETFESKPEEVDTTAYYVAGYIQEKHFQNMDSASDFYRLGFDLENSKKEEIFVLKSVAFKRKCRSKLDKASHED